jgi:hypothetical protein
MITAKTEFVVPARLSWLAMLLMIGIFGFIAQVGLSYTFLPDQVNIDDSLCSTS